MIATLVAAGTVAQAGIRFELRDDLVLLAFDSELLVVLSTILIASGGAVLAWWFAWHRPGFVWIAAGLPLALLLFGFGVAMYFSLYPIPLGHH